MARAGVLTALLVTGLAVAACGASSPEPRSSVVSAPRNATTAQNAAAGRWRFARPPVVLFAAPEPDRTVLRVFARLNRALPGNARRWRAEILLDGDAPETGLFQVPRRSRHCFTAEIGTSERPHAPSLSMPRDGQRVHVVLRVSGRDQARSSVAARRTSYSQLYDDVKERRWLRRLGC